MGIKIGGVNTGSVTINAPADGGDEIFTLPGDTGTGILVAQVNESIAEVPQPNMIINGDFRVWQRAFSYTGGVAGYNTADRWVNNASQDIAIQIVDGNTFFKVTQDIGPNTYIGIRQGVELKPAGSSYNSFKNKTFTVSYDIFIPAGYTDVEPYINVTYADDVVSPSTSTQITTYSPSGAYLADGVVNRVSHTFTVSVDQVSTDKAMTVVIGALKDVAFAVGEYVSFGNVKCEENTTATPFIRPDPSVELARCERYYYKNSVTVRCNAAIYNVAYVVCDHFDHPTTMRVSPSVTLIGIAFLGHDGTPGSLHSAGQSIHGFSAVYNWTSGTAGRSFKAEWDEIAFDAEL